MGVNAKQSVSGAVISGGNIRGSVGTGRVDVYSYYTPNVTQPDENTMQVEYTPSERNMPDIEPVTLILPKGKDGVDGYTPQKGVDYFDGAQGPQGPKGDKGEDGYTPQKGVDYFDGAQGPQGPKGDKGEDGYTPQKGVDYFTSNDISQVANVAANLVRDDIAAGIASAIGGSY